MYCTGSIIRSQQPRRNSRRTLVSTSTAKNYGAGSVRPPTQKKSSHNNSRKDERLGFCQCFVVLLPLRLLKIIRFIVIFIQLALQFLFLLPGGGRSVRGVGKHRVGWASPKPSFQPQPNDRLLPSSLTQSITTCDLQLRSHRYWTQRSTSLSGYFTSHDFWEFRFQFSYGPKHLQLDHDHRTP